MMLIMMMMIRRRMTVTTESGAPAVTVGRSQIANWLLAKTWFDVAFYRLGWRCWRVWDATEHEGTGVMVFCQKTVTIARTPRCLTNLHQCIWATYSFNYRQNVQYWQSWALVTNAEIIIIIMIIIIIRRQIQGKKGCGRPRTLFLDWLLKTGKWKMENVGKQCYVPD